MSDARHIIVMGVSGSGKSTVGRALADRLDAVFGDADDLHSAAAVAAMSAGHALTDAERMPWLDRCASWLADQEGDAVLACSALRRTYRDRLRSQCDTLETLCLTGDRAVIAERQANRPGHFMPTALLGSQLAEFEPLSDDERGVQVSVEQGVDAIVDEFVRRTG